MSGYYIADGNKPRGPFRLEELLREGVKIDSLVWREGMPEWKRADAVPEVRAMLGNPPGTPSLQETVAMPSAAQPAYAPAPAPPVGGPVPYNAGSVNTTKLAAGICGILLGGLGVHKFILGMTGAGLIMLLVSICTCAIGYPVMHLIGLIEGIIYLTKSDDEFYRLYMVEKKAWF